MPRLPSNLAALTEDLSVPALPAASVDVLRRLVDASPEEFQRGMSALLKRLTVEGFANIQAPRSIRELQTVVNLWRTVEGLDKDAKGALPPGLVGVFGGIRRNASPVTVEAEEVDSAPVFE